MGGCETETVTLIEPIPSIDYADLSEAVSAQITEAVAQLDAAPQDPDANGHLAMLLDTYGKLREAAPLYQRAKHLTLRNFQWTYLYALAQIELGNNNVAADALEQALSMRPGYPAAQLALAGLLRQSGDQARARALYEKLAERNPLNAHVHYEYGRFLLDQQQPGQAVASLQKALALSHRFGAAHYALSQAYRQSGQLALVDTHLALFERYRLLRPALNDPMRAKVDALNRSDANQFKRALQLSSVGRQQQAADVMEELIVRMPDDAGLHVNLIAIYGEMGRWEPAKRHAEQAEELDSSSVELHDNLGILALKQQGYSAAIEHFKRAKSLDPTYSIPYKNTGAVFDALGQTDNAINEFRQALELEPTDRQTRFFLGKALLEAGKTVDAIAVLEPLADGVRSEAVFHLQMLGRAYLIGGRNTEALEVLRKALRLSHARRLEGVGAELMQDIERVERASR